MRFAPVITIALLVSGLISVTGQAQTQSIDTGYRPSVNGFGFPNEGDGGSFFGVDVSRIIGSGFHDEVFSHTGHCYGMAFASIEDFKNNVTTIDTPVETAYPRINSIQTGQTFYYLLQWLTPPFGITSPDNTREYERLVDRLSAGSPAVIGVYSSGGGYPGHSIVTYRIDVVGNKSLIYAYDPNFPQTMNDYENSPMIATYDAEAGTFSYDNGRAFDQFRVNDIDGLWVAGTKAISAWLGLLSIGLLMLLPLLYSVF